MKKSIFLVVILAFSAKGYSQTPSGIPAKLAIMPQNSTTLSINDINRNFDSIMNNPDTTLNKEKIRLQRWMNYDLPKYNITNNGTTFDNKPYYKSLKSIYSGTLNCGVNDQAYWVPDGPDNYQTYYNPTDHQGITKQRNGWVNAVWTNPLNLNELLAGTRTSGIMRSVNSGASWSCVTDNMNFPVFGIRQIIGSPHVSNKLIALTGTSSIDGGVIYSDNNGASWSASSSNMESLHWVSYHPTQPGLVIGISNYGIYYSQNYGQTWTLSSNPVLGQHEMLRKIIVANSKVFIFSEINHTGKFRLYEYNLSGVSSSPAITLVGDVTNNFVPNNGICRLVGFSNTVATNSFMIEFLYELNGSGDVVLFKTNDSGISFSPITLNSAIKSYMMAGIIHKNELIMSPTDNSIFYYGTIFQMRRFNYSTQAAPEIIMDDNTNPGHHMDYRASMIINDMNKDRIVVGNDGGIALIVDGKSANPTIKSLNGDLSINLLHDFDIHPRTGVKLYALQDQDYVFRYPNGVYSDPMMWEGSAAMIQQHYPTAMVGENAYWMMLNSPNSVHPLVGPYYTTGTGTPYLGGAFLRYRNYPNRFARSLSDSTIIMNRAPMITHVVTVHDSIHVAGAIGVCQTKPSTIYVAERETDDNDEKLFKSTDDGATWTILNSTVLVSGSSTPELLWHRLMWNSIRAIEVDHRNENIVYCGIGGVYADYNGSEWIPADQKFRVIKSTNGGTSFIDYSEGLPALPIEELLTIDSDNGLIFCANSAGVYYRTNSMSSWQCYNKNLPGVEKTSLDYDYCNNMLYAATYGRGVWKTPVNIPITNTLQNQITTNQTWSEDGVINHDVVVKAGATLTITSTIYVSSNNKFIVEPNGKLIINGGHLTNLCGNYWQGVEVWGTSNQHQYAVSGYNNQGTLQLINGGSIENAINGARNWKPGDYNKIGGIITSNGGVFKNNRRAIEFVTYRNFSQTNPATTRPNVSNFVNTTFTVDDNIIGGPSLFIYHVSMWEVTGITYANCTFNNLCLSKPYNATSGNGGIYSIDANYTIKPGCSSPYSPCPTQNLTKSSFTGFRVGVEALNNVTSNTITIDQSIFTDNLCGVFVKGVNNPSINRNTIGLGGFTAIGLPGTTRHFGIRTENCTNYMIEENTINGLAGNDYVDGIQIDNSGANNTRIYKNNLNNLFIANRSLKVNRSSTDPYTGYQALCNAFSAFESRAIKVEATNNSEGIRSYQGNPTNLTSAGNTFINLVGGSIGVQNGSSWPLNYYHTGGITLPTTSGSVGFVTATNANSCPSSFGGGIVEFGLAGLKLSNTGMSQFTNDVTVLSAQKLNLEYTYTALIDQGNTEQIVQEINENWSDDAWELRDQIIARSPNVSTEALIAAIDKDILPNAMILEICLANPESVRGELFIEKIVAVSANPIPEYILSMIRNSWYEESSRSNLEKALGEVNDALSTQTSLLLTSVLNSEEVTDAEILEEISKHSSAYLTFEKIEYHLNKKEFIIARNILTTNSFRNPEDLLVFEDLSTYIDLLESIADDGRRVSELKNSELDVLVNLTNSKGLVSLTAKNVLCFFYNRCFEDEIEEKSLQVSETVGQNSKEDINRIYYQASLYPNPASDYSSIKWTIFEKIVNCKLKVYNSAGVVVLEKELTEVQGEDIIDTRTLSSGTYTVIIENNNERKTSDKLVIIEK